MFTTEIPGSSLHLPTSWSHFLISTNVPTPSMKIWIIKLILSLSFPVNSSNSTWSHRHLCEWSSLFSGPSLFSFVASVIMDSPSPQHIIFQTLQGHRMYHHQILNNVKILKACVLFCRHNSLSFLSTEVFLLKYFWTYEGLYFGHVLNFLLFVNLLSSPPILSWLLSDPLV